MIEVKHPTYFTINGWLVDLTRIEHWSYHQGAGKFHGIRTALTILQNFTQRGLRFQSEGHPITPEQVEKALFALRKLADYGYHIPPEVFAEQQQITTTNEFAA